MLFSKILIVSGMIIILYIVEENITLKAHTEFNT